MQTELLIVIIKIVVSIILGLLAGFGVVYIFNKMPAKWLCDYNEKPPVEITDPSIQRVKGNPWRWIYATGFIGILLRLSFFDIQFAAAVLFASWALLIIGLADLKYMIIPDQFVIMLALAAIGFIPYNDGAIDIIFGALVGGGAMLMVSILAGSLFKKEVMGFGDIKLFSALGLVLGLKGIITVLILTSLLSGVGAVIGLARKRYTKDDSQALGPYICFSAVAYMFVAWPFIMINAVF